MYVDHVVGEELTQGGSTNEYMSPSGSGNVQLPTSLQGTRSTTSNLHSIILPFCQKAFSYGNESSSFDAVSPSPTLAAINFLLKV